MRIFLDTNVLLEYICKREREIDVERMVYYAFEHGIQLYISSGSVYTIAYIVEKYLKVNGLSGEQKKEVLCNAITNILSVVNIANIEAIDFIAAANDEGFLDMEDSFQYQAAIVAKCDVLATFNIKDFSHRNTFLKVMTPSDFLKTVAIK